MIVRNRAWRRRKERLVTTKHQDVMQLFARQFHDPHAKPVPSLKQHQHGKLTHVQDLRLQMSLGEALRDDLYIAG